MSRISLAALVLATLTLGVGVRAQDHVHPQPAVDRLGTVHFPTSCARAVAQQFDRGVALLHSFEFGGAERTFAQVLASDSTCAMAWWGIAVSRWTNPMVPNIRDSARVRRGLEAAEAGARVAQGATDRERDYLDAVAALYRNSASRDQRARVLAYEQAMSQLAAKYPDDTEARIFHALALVAAAPPSDKTYANQRRAGAMLEELFAQQPDHPGLAHYIIHSYDVPALAGRAGEAARRYADIAPDAAHALHMPSHTFTRVGMWNESVGTNLRSMDAAVRASSIAEALHAADYAVYAYLQLRRDSAAREIVLRLPELNARFDPQAVTSAAPGSAGLFALAAIPARYALERRAWAEAADLPARQSDFPYTEAVTYFARALGASHIGDTAKARVSVDTLAVLHERLVAANESYWAEQVAIQHLGASAWLQFASGRHDVALDRMREAAEREDATEKAAVTPGPIAPARELLGDMLMRLDRPAEALAEYRAGLAREPNRYHTLKGAEAAAVATRDTRRHQDGVPPSARPAAGRDPAPGAGDVRRP
jgi:hypothetical protein